MTITGCTFGRSDGNGGVQMIPMEHEVSIKLPAGEAAEVLRRCILQHAQRLSGRDALYSPDATLSLLGQLRQDIDQYVSLFDAPEVEL